MKLKILFFGITRDLTDTSKAVLEVKEVSINLRDLKKILQKKYPNLTDLDMYAFAVNEEYANPETVLKDNDVVAVIPPVSGG